MFYFKLNRAVCESANKLKDMGPTRTSSRGHGDCRSTTRAPRSFVPTSLTSHASSKNLCSVLKYFKRGCVDTFDHNSQRRLTISLHFLAFSLLPSVSSTLRARAAKPSEFVVSWMSAAPGPMLTSSSALASPPAEDQGFGKILRSVWKL